MLSTVEGHDIVYPAVLIISPLTSLISDQLKKYKAAGLSAIHLASQAQPDYDSESLFDTILERKVSHIHVFAHTEHKWRSLLLMPSFINRIVALVVDEAHCIAKWGYEFRRAYSQMAHASSHILTCWYSCLSSNSNCLKIH